MRKHTILIEENRLESYTGFDLGLEEMAFSHIVAAKDNIKNRYY